MNFLMKAKAVTITPPGAIVDNDSWTTTTIDTLGYSQLDILVQLGALDADMVTLKAQESDASDLTGAADITGLVFGTSTQLSGAASALPLSTDDNKRYLFSINLQGRKRYIDLVATGGNGTTGTYLTAIGFLSGGDEQKYDAASLGYGQILAV